MIRDANKTTLRYWTRSECDVLLCWPDLRLDHVDASRAEGFHTIVDIHDAFTLGHVQHDVQHDVAASAAGSHTATQKDMVDEDMCKVLKHWMLTTEICW